MNTLTKIKNWLGFAVKSDSRLTENSLTTLSQDTQKKKMFYGKIIERQARVKLGMKEFKNALDTAERIHYPKNFDLMEQYRKVMRDGHLSAQVYNRKQKVLKQRFAIFEGDKLNEEKTKAFKKPIFFDTMDLALDAIFYGNSLLEFVPSQNKEFKEVRLIPRPHVVGKEGKIYFDLSSSVGYDYRDKSIRENNFLFEVDNGDLGLLEKAVPYVIRKNYSMDDWSIKSEKFGMPFIAFFTDEMDKASLENYDQMLTNMGSNGWARFGGKERNDMQYIEASHGTGSYQIYSELINMQNEELSKLISGGTATTDTQAFVGSAEVHERMLNDIVDADMRYMESVMTHQFLPFLVSHGYDFEGCEFRFVMPENKEEKQNTNENKKTEDKQNLSFSEKKKSFGTMILPNNSDDCCTLNNDDDNLEFDIDLSTFIKQVFEGQFKKGEISKPVFNIYNEILQAAISEGYENVPKKDKAFFNELLYNQSVFAANKTHSLQKDLDKQLAKLLTNEKEELRTFAQFQIEANKILTDYNQKWLRAEYNTSVASAQAAKKWQDIQRDKDLFPFLEFRTQGDKAVRGEHQRLNGIIRRVEDDFWNTHYPPLGFNCRCSVRKLEDTDSVKADSRLPLPKDLPQPSKGFEENVGKTAKVFDENKHSYSKDLSNKEKESIKKQVGLDSKTLLQNDNFKKVNERVKLKELDKVFPQLSETEATALHYYTDGGFSELNKMLRGKIETNDFLTTYAQTMQDALKKLPNFKGTVFRNAKLRQEIIEEYRKAFEEKQPYKHTFFTSTSKNKEAMADLYSSGNVDFEIVSKTGKYINAISYYGEKFADEVDSEYEVLFLKDTNFEVVDFIKNGSNFTIKLKEL